MAEQLDILPPHKYLGLDIDEKSIKLVEIQDAPQGMLLTKFAVENVVGQENASAAIAAAIKKLFSSQNIEGKEVFTALTGLSVSIRRIRIPEIPDSEIRGAIKWEAKNYLPFPVDNIHIDYSILGKVKENNVNKLDVLAVAAPQEEINKITGTVESAGIKIAGLTIAPFAMWDLLKICAKPVENEVTAVIDIGSEAASINLFKNNILQFTREISVAGEGLTKCLTGTIVADNFQLNLNRDQAEAIKIKYGIPAETSVEKTGEGIPLSQIRAAMKPTLRRLTNEIQRSFDYYKEQFLEEKIGKIYLSGGSSRLLNLDTFITESFGIPAEVINPLQNLKLSPEVAAQENELNHLAPRLLLALGLAVGRTQSLNLIRVPAKKKVKLAAGEAIHALDLSKISWPKIDLSAFKTGIKIKNFTKFLETPSSIWILAAALVVSLTLGGFCYIYYLHRKADYYRQVLNDKKTFLADLKSLLARRQVIQQISEQETKVKETLGKIASIVPTGITLDSLEYKNNTREALISGSCESMQKAGEIVKAVESSPYFSGVKLKEIKKITEAGKIRAAFTLSFHVD
ncbi:MAG: type IV pilus assembly protein PilM [Candidatus Margulisiibacteriota bacterium]